ncbi:MAG: aminopeptidase P family protein [Candidatus Dadabacteria bacterium]|nr:aminopeptidase P family protein [Candidatus Dadabacteria bacterium]NIS07182.1 aminopeptidase P family protein [Candidatus Dadabacteria bacterium]NIV41226.1 M24 family metallopeptidase [Candidatus Dadabacteria bacterium]NIX14311.1 M24 family metallopeptidase [Candidatus Dadabacteria bacterium]NIY20960.1 M24 family metallopeptidase [Candidatus Dadabacteria bacterium]
MSRASLIIDKSESNADLLYKTRFFVPDPCIYIENKGKKILVLSDLEIDRGREEATVDSVLSYSQYINKLPANKRKKAGFTEVVGLIFKEQKIKIATVPAMFPLKYADGLRKLGYKIIPKNSEPFFEARLKKNKDEVEFLRQSLRKTADAMRVAVNIISESEIKNNKLYYNKKILTSELLQGEINSYLSKWGFTASHTIVASGEQGSMPHHSGSGPIIVHTPVVIDIFPRSQHTGYFGDMTRTVIKGEPSKEVKKMYRVVREGQKIGINMIKHGVKSKDVHCTIVEYFENSGFSTGNIDGKQQGFIHSTGHGLGLEIHEPPRVSKGDDLLEAGNVVTIEPGLYYEKLGGIRIEDVVLVTKKGCEILSRFPKKFQV